jgi:two-component system, NarL family, response regulator DegU
MCLVPQYNFANIIYDWFAMGQKIYAFKNTNNAKKKLMKEEPIRIVIADSHQIVRQGLIRELSKQNDLLIVGESATSDEVLQLILDQAPDIVILDGHLGIRVMQEIHKRETCSVNLQSNPPKILVLSTHGDKHFVWSLLAAGVRGYLLKSETPQEIVRGIRQLNQGKTILSEAIQATLVDLIPMLNNDLTSREIDVIKLLAKGLINQEIAKKLQISERTVRNHLHNIYRKVPIIKTRAEAVVWAWINHLTA